ncbi:amino acid ABC transporter permease [Cellulomonas sp. ACRRI]|uniref:amino acid ABC transporter permease n=1 Tax=Cellulomonas sp. ACRRI TaxID=2918188 RepID=UPI001EF20DFD|nr:amino acid ABC transporter permease [Cellulomonas sp. ACRRI]MCG7285742.1 amino acid ABC transporter permease [Cellulomonas sp. ACRRI]
MTTTSTPAPGTLPASRRRWSPRRRQRAFRLAQYALLVVVLVAVALAIDWENVGTNFFNAQAASDIAALIPAAFLKTLEYTFAGFAVGLSLGTVLALMRLSSVGLYRWLAIVYIEFFRGIPALLVVISFGYAVPIAFGVNIPSVTLKAALALGLVSAAYIAETLRAGLQAVPTGQLEAARSLGMSHGRTLRQVVVPQAFRIVLPPMTNEFILLTKDTSLVFLLGLSTSQYDLTKIGRDALNSAQGGLTPLFVIGACYLLITLPLGQLARYLEKRTGARSRT